MFRQKISRKETLNTLLKYPLRYYLMRLCHSHFIAGRPQLAIYSFDYIGQSISVDGIYEIRELELIESWLKCEKPHILSGTCLDIGANIGNHSVFFSKLFKQVIAFEPHPFAYRLLNLNTESFSNIFVNKFGLSNKKQKAQFYTYCGNVGGSSMVKGECAGIEKTLLDVYALDDIIERKDTIKFVKIDVEGHELEVIEGGKELFSFYHPLVLFEQQVNDFINGSSTVIAKLKEYGYNNFYSMKTSPIRVNKNSLHGKLITLFYSLIFGGSKVMVKETSFSPGFYPMIVAERNSATLEKPD